MPPEGKVCEVFVSCANSQTTLLVLHKAFLNRRDTIIHIQFNRKRVGMSICPHEFWCPPLKYFLAVFEVILIGKKLKIYVCLFMLACRKH